MSGPGNGARRFTLHHSGAIAAAIRRLHRRAWRQGRGTAVTRALRQIVRRLQLDPFHVGEPAYRLPGLRLHVRSVIVRPLVVDFAVSEDHPVVFIKGVKLLSI
jgi:hypothetical protein